MAAGKTSTLTFRIERGPKEALRAVYERRSPREHRNSDGRTRETTDASCDGSGQRVKTLARYGCPGNVRELVNVLERAVVLSCDDTIRAEDLPDRPHAPAPGITSITETGLSLDEMERRHVEQGLGRAHGPSKKPPRGINVTTLWRKRKRYGIQ